MRQHEVTRLIDLPRDILRKAAIDAGESGAAALTLIALEQPR